MINSNWRSFARLFTDSRRLLGFSFATSIAQSALLLPVALLVKHAFDDLVPKGEAGQLVWVGAAILALYLATAGLGLWTRYAVLKATKRAITRMRTDLLRRVYRFPRAYFDRSELGVLNSTIVQDSERLDIMSNALVAQLIPAFIVAMGLSGVLLILNPLLFVILLAVVPLLLGVSRVLGRSVRGKTRVYQRTFDVFSTQTQLALRAITLTKVHAAESVELERRRREFVDLARAGHDMAWTQSAYTLVQMAVAASAGVVVLVVGGRGVANGTMTLGELLSFYAVLALLLRQVNTILSTAPQVLAGYESMARLEAILETDEPEPYRGTRRIEFRGAIALDGVGFGYGREPVLRDVSLWVKPGDRVAIVGPNGAGKSTLLNLVLGLYRPQRGRVLADDEPYEELDLPALRTKMGVVLQDPVIFPGTIAENIAYGRPEASTDEVRRAAEWATASSFVESLPDGYETAVGDEGVRLSGGQRQRVAIARALLAQPAMLILDEPTTHLDDSSIRQLMENLRHFPGAPSLIMISHDMEVAREADVVYHLRDGRIVGTERTEPATPLPVLQEQQR